MDNLSKLVGKKIRELRKMKVLTMEGLSEKSGLQTSYLAAVERGDRNITLQTLEKIVNGLEEDVSVVFDFKNFENGEQDLRLKEKVELIRHLLVDKTEEEINLIYSITKSIFETYEKS